MLGSLLRRRNAHMRSTWVSCRVLSTYRKHCFAEPKRDVTWDNSLMHSKACISITILVIANRRTLTIQLLDFRAAAVLMPADASIQADIVETERLLALTKKEAAAYVARQPKPLLWCLLVKECHWQKDWTWDTSASTIHGYEGGRAPSLLNPFCKCICGENYHLCICHILSVIWCYWSHSYINCWSHTWCSVKVKVKCSHLLWKWILVKLPDRWAGLS